MKYRKFNKFEKKENRQALLKTVLAGTGLFLYENSSRTGDLSLPRPTASGLRRVGPGKQFQGDDYYMQMVKTGDLKLIKVLQPTKAQEESLVAEKLILDQPDIVTEKGKVEHVAEPAAKPLVEADNQPEVEVLLNEQPVDDGFVIVGD